ncbi:5-oxoprolinase subunit PxpA [Nakamurella aerolata]|uniref:5-oxoprolinase subunit PxpA n=1 Tax=Nakamurella aerolata TaxID=1656892 RepID=A0A849A8L5_9ACTN|nr:5-oxoprolinase subunit PxpA [Nakamurella aerolata]NNG35863.1 5-oxoprolinase subunit PxpA [Nakamurella aerolata]
MAAARDQGITINSDLGEGVGLHRFGNDAALLELVDVANVACGFHAGDPAVMAETVAAAAEHGVRIGAHPGLPDLAGFGRRELKLTKDEVDQLLTYQVGALVGFLTAHGVRLNHLKPHGSLYGMLARDPELMLAAARVAGRYGVPFYGMVGTAHETVCAAADVPFVGELYVDLNYRADGSLIIERKAHPVDPAAAAERVRQALRTGRIDAADGSSIEVQFSSVCVHSDGPNAVPVAEAVRAVMDSESAVPGPAVLGPEEGTS